MDASAHIVPPRYITSDIAPIGGVIKQRHEDFFVEEIPLYQPQGEGEHIYLFIEKRGLSTFDLLDIVGQHFGVGRVALGSAGLKDKHAVTRQVVSVHVPGKTLSDFPDLRHEKLTLLWADQHVNKLRTGHLIGNRFSIRIRNVSPTGVLSAKKVLDRLARTGVPNRIGEQRFGHLENNHLVARAMLLDDHKAALDTLLGPSKIKPDAQAQSRAAYLAGNYPDALHHMPRHLAAESAVLRQLCKGVASERALNAIDPRARSFYLTAFQSAVFNAVLDQRVIDSTFDKLLEGDLAFKHENRAVFAVDSAVLADPTTTDRLAKFEISPSGPMWASGMTRASGAIDDAEQNALAALDVTPDLLAAYEKKHRDMMEGARRPLRIPLIDPEAEGGVDEHGAYVRVAFELPRGSFATVVLREIMKPQNGSLVDADEAGTG
jgi:tRNA pseudouridine13 synthase